ncbi:MAG: hypothetical protein KC646_09010 [Candidatus Cloacimonetes bacterium]|nr:hypothetical protein [Candidatus Cloacimonadota bacterium]
MKKLLYIFTCLLSVAEVYCTQLQDEDYAKIMAMTISEIQHRHASLKIGVVSSSQDRAEAFKHAFEKIAKLRSGSRPIQYEIFRENSPSTSTANVLLQLDDGFVMPKHIFSIAISKRMVEKGACLGIVVVRTRPTILGNRDTINSSNTKFDRAFQRFIQVLNGGEL